MSCLPFFCRIGRRTPSNRSTGPIPFNVHTIAIAFSGGYSAWPLMGVVKRNMTAPADINERIGALSGPTKGEFDLRSHFPSLKRCHPLAAEGFEPSIRQRRMAAFEAVLCAVRVRGLNSCGRAGLATGRVKGSTPSQTSFSPARRDAARKMVETRGI